MVITEVSVITIDKFAYFLEIKEQHNHPH